MMEKKKKIVFSKFPFSQLKISISFPEEKVFELFLFYFIIFFFFHKTHPRQVICKFRKKSYL